VSEKSLHELSHQGREYYEKGAIAFQRSNFDNGVHYLLEMLKLEPAFLKGRQLLRAAEIKQSRSKGSGTISKFFGSIASSPALAMSNVKKDAKKAMEIAEEALVKNPFNVQALRLLAEAAESMDLIATAIDAHETARAGSPDNVTVLMELGRLYQAGGRADDGLSCYERVLKLEPDNSDAFQGVKDATANAAMQAGKWEQEGTYRDMMKDAGEARSLEQAGRIFKDEDVVRSQMEDVYRQAQEQPDNVSLWKKLGDLALQINNFDYAIENYQHAFGLTQGADVSLEKLIVNTRIKKIEHLILQKEKQAETGGHSGIRQEIAALREECETILLQECEARVKRYPNDLDLRYELAQIYFQMKWIDKAMAEFQLAVANPRTRVACTNWLAQCFREKGMLDMAVQRFKSAAEQNSVMDGLKKEIIYNLASVYEQMKKKEEAIEQYKIIYDVDVTYRDVAKKIEDYYKSRSGE